MPAWRRIAKRAVTLGGAEIPEGAKLFLWVAAGGRDASVFPEPDAFDLRRPNAKRHLAFGKGIHFCIGSALGKFEAQLAVEELTRRFPRLRLVDGQQLRFHPNISFPGAAGAAGVRRLSVAPPRVTTVTAAHERPT